MSLDLYAILGGVAAFLAALGAAFMRGRKSKNNEVKRQDLEDYRRSRKVIDDATNTDHDADTARQRLRDRQSQR